MNCPICKSKSWKNVDEFRIKPQGMSLCQSCGFVSYPDKYKNLEAVIDYYRKEYRPAPSVQNLYTGMRKLHYHGAFLKPLIERWIKEGKKDPVVCDVGAAFGMALHWWRTLSMPDSREPAFPNADLNGVELTLSFRRVAYHEYGLNLKERFDETKQYDIISSYKVLEHQFDPDLELQRYHKCLKQDGYLYISVPTWFARMHAFGVGGWDIEYYYHKDHVNVWTRAHFEKLLADSGFEIVQKDFSIYDDTYLCVKTSREIKPVKLDLADSVKLSLAKIQIADEAAQKRDFDGAVEAWPRFPIARRNRYEFNRAAEHKLGWEHIRGKHIDSWFDIDPECNEALGFAADLALRYDQFPESIAWYTDLIKRRPGCEQAFHGLSCVYRQMAKKTKKENERVEFLSQARKLSLHLKTISLAAHGQAVTWSYTDSAELPMPDEVN